MLLHARAAGLQAVARLAGCEAGEQVAQEALRTISPAVSIRSRPYFLGSDILVSDQSSWRVRSGARAAVLRL